MIFIEKSKTVLPQNPDNSGCAPNINKTYEVVQVECVTRVPDIWL